VTDKFTTKGFADYFIEQRGYTNTFLEKIDMLINWENIEKLINMKYKKVASADGRPAYPGLPMFKLLLLQRWHGLSDPEAEAALKDRISFILFTGFLLNLPLLNSAISSALRSPFISSSIILVPLTPNISEATQESFIFASSRIFSIPAIKLTRKYSQFADRRSIEISGDYDLMLIATPPMIYTKT